MKSLSFASLSLGLMIFVSLLNRSKGKAQAMFLRHEGYLGALGAFLSYDKPGLSTVTTHQFVERFPIGAPFAGGEIHGPPIRDLNEKVNMTVSFQSLHSG